MRDRRSSHELASASRVGCVQDVDTRWVETPGRNIGKPGGTVSRECRGRRCSAEHCRGQKDKQIPSHATVAAIQLHADVHFIYKIFLIGDTV